MSIVSLGVSLREFWSRIEKASHGNANPAGLKKSLVADQKNLFSSESASAGAHLIQHSSAENYFRHLEFIIMQCVVLMFFHYRPFVAN